jgi:hypothetical protein
MLWTPQKGRGTVITNAGIVGSATPWTAVPSNATTLLDGAVTELISAANNVRDSWGIAIAITNTGIVTTASEAALDILIGGATDDVLIDSLLCGHRCVGGSVAQYYFPLHIPAGVRIAARLAAVRTSINANVGVWLYGGTPPPHKVGRKVTTYGTKVNGARGADLTVTASGGAASATQMTASSTEDHFYLVPGFQPHADSSLTPDGHLAIGIGVGAATEERIGTWWYGKDTTERVSGPIPTGGVFQDVPAASRLTVLASNSGANDTGGYDGHIYAVS